MSKAVGGSVTRNRVKRRLRAQVAPFVPGLPHGLDLVVRANPAAATATSAELGETLGHLVPRVVAATAGESAAR